MSLNISAVSFGTGNETITREGRYTQTSQAQTKTQEMPADTFVKPKKHKALKAIGWTVAAAAVVAAGLALAVKTGKLNKVEEASNILAHAKNYGAAIGKKVLKVSQDVTDWSLKQINKFRGHAETPAA